MILLGGHAADGDHDAVSSVEPGMSDGRRGALRERLVDDAVVDDAGRAGRECGDRLEFAGDAGRHRDDRGGAAQKSPIKKRRRLELQPGRLACCDNALCWMTTTCVGDALRSLAQIAMMFMCSVLASNSSGRSRRRKPTRRGSAASGRAASRETMRTPDGTTSSSAPRRRWRRNVTRRPAARKAGREAHVQPLGPAAGKIGQVDDEVGAGESRIFVHEPGPDASPCSSNINSGLHR